MSLLKEPTLLAAKPTQGLYPRIRPRPLRVHVATTMDEVLQWEPAWRALRSQQLSPPPNTEPVRFRRIAETEGPGVEPYLAVWHRGDEPCAMILGRISLKRVACRIGYFTLPLGRVRSLDVVYGGLITDESTATRDAVLAHLQCLLRTGTIDRLTFNHLDLEHSLASRLLSLRPIRDKVEPHWTIHLKDGDFDATLAHHSSKHRSNLRRLDRRLTKRSGGRVELQCVRKEPSVGEFVAIATEIARQTYHRQLPTGTDNPGQWQQILEAEAAADRLMCFVLIADGRPIAYQAGTLYGTRYYCEGTSYLPEFADLNPGTVLLMRVLRSLCEAGVETVDFGFGDAEYKKRYGNEARMEASLRLYSRTPRALLLGATDRGLHAARDLAARGARALGIFQRIRKLWRARMTTVSTRRANATSHVPVEQGQC